MPTPDLDLAYARARAGRAMSEAAARFYAATTGTQRDAAEADWNAAQARLDALPGLIPPDRLARLIQTWAKEDR